MTTCPPWSNKKTDTAAQHPNIFISNPMLSILYKIYKMLAILGFQFKMQIKLPSPVVRTGNGQGQKVVKVVNNFKNEGEERESPE